MEIADANIAARKEGSIGMSIIYSVLYCYLQINQTKYIKSILHYAEGSSIISR